MGQLGHWGVRLAKPQGGAPAAFSAGRPSVPLAERKAQPKPPAFSPSATHRMGLAHTASLGVAGRCLWHRPPSYIAKRCQVFGGAQFSIASLRDAQSPVRSTLCRRSAKLDPTNLRQSTTKHLCSSSFFVDIFKRSRPQATRSGKHPVALKYTN